MVQVCNIHLGSYFLSNRKEEAQQTLAGYEMQVTAEKQEQRQRKSGETC